MRQAIPIEPGDLVKRISENVPAEILGRKTMVPVENKRRKKDSAESLRQLCVLHGSRNMVRLRDRFKGVSATFRHLPRL